MPNHNQFLLSIVSYTFYLFGQFAEVLILTGKSDAYKKLICIVKRIALSCPSRCQKFDKIFFAIFVLRYAATVFANAVRLLTSCSYVSST